jgi:DNA polymerase
MIAHWDFETTSACDIKLGAYRYASDPSTRILMFAILVDDEAPLAWRFDDPQCEESLAAVALLRKVIEEGHLLFAHNAPFELAIATYRLMQDVGVRPPSIEQIRCTMAMCRTAALPPSLAGASEFLKLGVDKDKRGKALIGIFSDQTKVVTLTRGKEKMKTGNPILEDDIPWDWMVTVGGESMTVRAAWLAFIEYNRQDVRVERGVHKTLHKFELEGQELEGFLFDLRMNLRGIPVNLPALGTAQAIIESVGAKLAAEFTEVTGLQPTQTMKVLQWLQERGYPGADLTGATMKEYLGHESLIGDAPRALEIRSLLSFAAVKKVKAMKETACPDGHMKGLFTWYGAQRTGRWTSGGPQPQNARRPSIKDADFVYSLVCDGIDPDGFSSLYEKEYECMASVVRNFIQPHQGMMLDADYSNIESRVAALIAGQESMLDAYREGRDLYKELAVAIFNVPFEEVTKEQRFVAKIASLACIYSTGARTFHETCATWGMPIEKKLACHTVRVFRQTNEQFPITWRKYGTTAVKAINEPGVWHPVNEFVAFAYSNTKPFPRLVMRLPSGRKLVLPMPKVSRVMKKHRDYETGEEREWETDEISFYGSLRGYAGWGRVATYPADLFQSSVQATARDIMQNGCLNAQAKGFEIFALIHDQALAHDGDIDQFVDALCTRPSWLPENFPLAAEGNRVPYYSK